MPLPLSLYIGLRYTRAKRRNHFISFISWISIIGIALGVTALITVLSVMNGFDSEIREQILSMSPHITITGAGDQGALKDWPGLVQKLQGEPKIVGAAPFVGGQGLLVNQNISQFSAVYGVLPNQQATVSKLAVKMRQGQLTSLVAGKFHIILGQDLANFLGVSLDDSVILVTPNIMLSPVGALPQMRRFTVSGIFQAGYQYDNNLAFIDLTDAANLFRFGKTVSGVNLKLTDLYAAPALTAQLSQKLGPTYALTDWTQQNKTFFQVLRLEKNMIFLMLLLIVAVAAFNILATLVMVVRDKSAEIAILKTLGAAPATILRIFIVQGCVIGLLGLLVGVIGGVTLALNVSQLALFIEHAFHVQLLPPQVYLISELPSELDWRDVATIAIITFTMTLAATLYPAFRASRTEPAEALRYE
jgi:lipoprotein-releasing system permease protein